MPEYIERRTLLDAIAKSMEENPHKRGAVRANHVQEHIHFMDIVRQIEPEEVERIQHGRWIKSDRYPDFRCCSVCGLETGNLWSGKPYKYCPICGAEMEEEP